jgi:hypothetical protein
MKKSNHREKRNLGEGRRFLDVRIVFYKRHQALAAYIKTQARKNERYDRDQIVYMLTYAASQMSAHDLQPTPPEGK